MLMKLVEGELILVSDLPNRNLQIDTILLRLANEVGLLASLSHMLAKLDNFLHNCCLIWKMLKLFLGKCLKVRQRVFFCILQYLLLHKKIVSYFS